MKISELARRSGVSAHRLRRYELQGLLSGTRTAAGWRDFPESCLREVTFIRMSRELGFSLEQVAEQMPRYRAGTLGIDEMVDSLQRRITEVDALIAEQRALRRRLVEHVAWFEARRTRAKAKATQPQPATRWPSPRKERP